MTKSLPKTFSKSKLKKKLTLGEIRKAVRKMKECEIKPDAEGDLHFDPLSGRWIDPILDSWLKGKPVGGA